MRATEQQHNERKREMMEKCFECYAENGLTGTGIKALAAACGCTTGNLYSYFNSVDELILESTAYCMAKVENDFIKKAPTDPKDAMRFIEEVPYWTAKKHGKKYRLMYQINTHSKYIEYEKKFFEGSTSAIPNMLNCWSLKLVFRTLPFFAYFYICSRLRALCHV